MRPRPGATGETVPDPPSPGEGPADQAGEGDGRLVGEIPGRFVVLKRHSVAIEAALAVAIAACVFVVHDVPYLLRAPFWVDEAWVAVSTRTSVSHIFTVTSASPVGFTWLLRLVPTPGGQDLRLLPLLFAAMAALAAYAFARTLRLLPFVAGGLAAGAALLSPAMLVRDDLKEYTADAFVMLVGLALLSWVESEWSRRRVITMASALVVLAFVSNVTLFVAAIGLPSVTVVQALRRRWTAALESAAVTVVAGLLLLIVFLVFDGGTQTASLKAYWNGYYLPHHLSSAYHYIDYRIHALLPYFGIVHLWLLLLLVLGGLGVLAWQGRWATAAVLPLVALLLVVLSFFQKFPLLEQRTSTFLVTASVVVAAIGVAGVATIAARHVHLLLGVGIAIAAVSAYLPGALPYVDSHRIPYEDARDQVIYVQSHRGPEDVVLVDQGASYAYGYYAKAAFGIVKATGIGFSIVYPPADRTVVLVYRQPKDVQAGFEQAWSLVSQHPGARLWVVLSHVPSYEMQAWNAELQPRHLQQVQVARGTDVRYLVVPV